MRTAAIAIGLLLVVPCAPALAAPAASGFNEAVMSSAVSRGWTGQSPSVAPDPLRVTWTAPAAAPADVAAAPLPIDLEADASAAAVPAGAGGYGGRTFHRPVVYSYTHGFYVRRKIHVYASIAMLPLFVTEAVLGEKLYNNPYDNSLRHAHGFVATGIYGLFGLNSVTGIWNLWDERKDPHDRTVRTIHGILMLASAVGMLGTAATAPKIRQGLTQFNSRKTLHLGWATTSMSLATAGYLIMLLFNR